MYLCAGKHRILSYEYTVEKGLNKPVVTLTTKDFIPVHLYKMQSVPLVEYRGKDHEEVNH